MEAWGTDNLNVAEPKAKAPFELGVKLGPGRATRRFASWVASVQTMEDRRPVRGSTANGPEEKKCSSARPSVVALMGHRGNYGALTVGPAVNGNPGTFADPGASTVRADQEGGRNQLTIVELHVQTRCGCLRPRLRRCGWRLHRCLIEAGCLRRGPLRSTPQRGGRSRPCARMVLRALHLRRMSGISDAAGHWARCR